LADKIGQLYPLTDIPSAVAKLHTVAYSLVCPQIPNIPIGCFSVRVDLFSMYFSRTLLLAACQARVVKCSCWTMDFPGNSWTRTENCDLRVRTQGSVALYAMRQLLPTTTVSV